MKLCGRCGNYLSYSLLIFELYQGAQFLKPALSTTLTSYTTGWNIIFASLPVENFLPPLPVVVFWFQILSISKFLYYDLFIMKTAITITLLIKISLIYSMVQKYFSIDIDTFSINLSYTILHQNWSRVSNRLFGNNAHISSSLYAQCPVLCLT